MKTCCRRPLRRVSLLFAFAAVSAAGAPPNTYYELPQSPYRLSPLFAPYETQYYRVENFGFYYSSLYQPHAPYRYPGPNDLNPAGLLNQSFDSAVGDFNGDGWQDIVLNLTGMPHVADKLVNLRPVVLLNDRKGGMYYDPTLFDGLPPTRLFTYRVLVADFNRDGIDDFVSNGFGLIRWTATGEREIIKEPIPLVLSQPGGKLKDATRQIEGQENGGVPAGFDFGHDLAVGDVDGDGTIDFMQGSCLFLNDGRGNFRNATAQLPAAARVIGIPMMSSAIADLNGDGFGDLVCGYFPGSVPGYIILSNGRSVLTGSTSVVLPAGPYGATNTRQNHMVIGDLNGDGRPDIVIGQTRGQPYYEGRVLQIIMNRGGGVFADESAARIDNSLRFGSNSAISNSGVVGDDGEGQLSLVDANADGFVDIVDQNSLVATNRAGVTIFLNDGTGRFTHSPSSALAFVPKFAVAGMENFQANPEPVYLPRPVPVNLDKQLGLDFVGFVYTPGFGVGYSLDFSLYTIRNLQPLGGAAVAPAIVTQPASQTVGAFASVLFSVVATGNPAPTYQWKYNGLDLPGQNHSRLWLSAAAPDRTGSYTVVVSNSAGSVTSNPAVLSVTSEQAGGINPHPRGVVAAAGTDVVLTSGTPSTSRQWYHNGIAIPGATDVTLTLRNVQLSDAGAYVMIATRAGGPTRSNGARLTVTATTDAPAIVVEPTSEMIVPGTTQRLAVGAAGALPLTYQWRKDGAIIAVATAPILPFNDAADAGSFTCTVTNALGSVTTRAATLSSYDPGRIINLSILTDISAEASMFTVGTVIGGAGTAGAKPLLIRAMGPSLAPLGVTSTLADPRLDIFSGSSVAASNDDWSGAANISTLGAQVGAFGFTSAASRDAAVAFTPAAGPYTVQVSGTSGTSGNVIAEVYDATPNGTFAPNTPRLINVSVLKQINAGSLLTAGFVIGGETTKQVLIRAVGPTLGAAPFGVPDVMADPKIEVLDSAARIVASNDNWSGDATMTAAFTAVGAFALPAGSRDAAVLVSLTRGSYTVQISGVGSTGGTALVEVYEVP